MFTSAFTTGCVIALVVTWVVALFCGFSQARSDRYAVSESLRLFLEVFLVIAFLCLLAATAVLGSAAAWQLFCGYTAVRIVALGIEAALSLRQ